MRKNYLNFISLSKFLSFYSENIIIFLLPIITYRFFHKIEDSGLIIFFHFLFRLLGYPVSGILCDRLDEKKIITAVAFIRGIFFLSLFSLYNLWNPENHSLLFILLSFLSSADGFAGGVASIAFETTGPKLYPHSKFRDFQVSTQTADQCALLLAPATGAFILDAFGSSLTLATVSTLFLCSGITFLPCLKLKNIETDPNLPMMINSGGLIQTPLDTVRAILKNRLILITLGMTILDNFLLGLYSALLVPLSLNIFHESEKNLGWVLTFGYFASMGAIHWSHWIQKKKSTLWLWKWSYTIAYLGFFLMGLAPNFIIYAISILLIETSCASGIFALRLIRSEIIPKYNFGKISGILFLLQQITIPLGGLVIATFHHPEHLQNLILFSAGITGTLTLILMIIEFKEIKFTSLK